MTTFPCTSKSDFPKDIHSYLHDADNGKFRFPSPDDMDASPQINMGARDERVLRLAYFNYWLAALRVYYINAAWTDTHRKLGEPSAGAFYATACSAIDDEYKSAMMELFEHYGYDYEGPPPRRVV